MRSFLSQAVGRFLSILVAMSLFMGTASAGMSAMANGFASSIRKAFQAQLPPGYTEMPGPIYLGDNPSRDAKYRGGIWNDSTLADLQSAALQWGATPSQVGARGWNPQ